MRIRAAKFDDLEKIKELCVRNNLKVKKINKEVWRNFPNFNDFENIPIGWVIESNEGNIVGVILNLFMNYILNDKTYKASVVSTWAVDNNYRSESMNLIFKWIYQKNVDLLVFDINSESTLNFEKFFNFFLSFFKPIDSHVSVITTSALLTALAGSSTS